MAEQITELLNKGIYNLVNDENIPQEAASTALGWISNDDAIELSRGRILHGEEKTYRSNQKQTQQNATIAFGEDDNTGNNFYIAQKFRTKEETASETKQDINGVLVYKKQDTGSADDFVVTLSIQADSSGDPSGSDLVSKTFTTTEWKNLGEGTIRAIFSSAYELDRGTDYWIVAKVATGDANNHPNLGYRDIDVYSEGQIKKFSTNSGWEEVTGDLMFHVLEETLVPGGVTGHHVSYKVNGSEVFFRKAGSGIQYYDENASMYVDVFSTYTNGSGETLDIDPNEPASFSDYTSLSGNFVFIGHKNGLWSISVANPQDFADLYDEAKNFRGRILIDRSRMLLWGREDDKTGLYGSKIDPQDGTVYTTVSNETLGSSGDTSYSGVLAFKAGGARRTCFGVSISADYTDGTETKTETFRDDYSGNLTSEEGGTGTINYMTGVYTVNFANTTTSDPQAGYQWEDATNGGIADFTKSTPRTASEGFIFRQDKGGDGIENVFIQEGKYVSIKERSSYELALSDDDSTASNLPYRDNIGLPYWKAGVSAQSGIIFMNTANLDRPTLTILQRSTVSSILEPVNIAEHFDFSEYLWDQCNMATYNEYIVFTGRTKNSDTNNTLFIYNPRFNSVDTVPFAINTLVKSNGLLYAGSSVNHSVSKILNGFDDDGSVVENYWESRNELYGSNNLKRLRRLRLKGLISKEQRIKVFISYDGDSFQQVGTIRGDASYVDNSVSYAIGTAGIGTSTIGGETSNVAYPFIIEIKLTRAPKFRGRKIRLEAEEIGYASINKITDYDILLYENKLPAKYRLKQNVSLDGDDTDQ